MGPRQACDKYSIALVGDITQVQRREVISVGILFKNLVTEGKDFVFQTERGKTARTGRCCRTRKQPADRAALL